MTADLAALVAGAAPEELPLLIGQLEAAKAAAFARLVETSRKPAAQPDKNLTVGEAAQRIGLSTQWIYRNHARLPFCRKIGRRVVCSARGIAEWNGRQQG